MKKLGLYLLFILFGSLIYGYYLYNDPVKSIANQKASAQVNAQNLFTAFDEDESAANTKYLDKILEVEGIVEKIVKENNKISIYLSTENMMSSIICELEDGQKYEGREGDNIKIKGICTGYLMDVILVRAVIIPKT